MIDIHTNIPTEGMRSEAPLLPGQLPDETWGIVKGQLSDETWSLVKASIPIPTIDLVVNIPGDGVVIARRIIEPYKRQWALPGLRNYMEESIDGTVRRIAQDELGIEVDTANKKTLEPYKAKFPTRTDFSTCFVVDALSDTIKLNRKHFSSFRIINSMDELPAATGAMYVHHLKNHFAPRSS